MNSHAIAGKIFEKKSFGYKTDDVSEYLKEVAAYCASLEESLKISEEKLSDADTKIEVLADKIRDYRDQEESLKDAIMSAHKIGSEISANAKAKALQMTDEAKATSEKLLSDAKADASKITADANEQAEILLGKKSEQAELEQRRLDSLKKEVADFKASLYSLYKRHLKLIERLPEPEVSSNDVSSSSSAITDIDDTPEPKASEPISAETLAEDIPKETKPMEESVAEYLADEPDAAKEPPVEESAPVEEPPSFASSAESEYEELPSFLKNVYEQPKEEELSTEDISDLYHKHEAEKTRLASSDNDKLNMKITVKAKSDIKSFNDSDFVSKSSEL